MTKIRRTHYFSENILKILEELSLNSKTALGVHLSMGQLLELMIEYFSKNDLNILLKK
jgi:hypothetical protein